VQCWDKTHAKYADGKTVLKALSGGLILDGEAAKALCDRGYAPFLGVDVGDDITIGSNLKYDLYAREVVCDAFATPSKGKRMMAAHMYAPCGQGKAFRLERVDSRCEVLSEHYSGFGEYIGPAMTRFENALGGRIVVMGLTLDGNNSQALYNYRRQRLLQSLVRWCGGEFVFAEGEPDVFTIVNTPTDSENADFTALITLTSLAEDTVGEIRLYLPKAWRGYEVKRLNVEGERVAVAQTPTENGVIIQEELRYLETEYFLVTKRKRD
jgi:hypothetical protein